jgi:hypothetical protein
VVEEQLLPGVRRIGEAHWELALEGRRGGQQRVEDVELDRHDDVGAIGEVDRQGAGVQTGCGIRRHEDRHPDDERRVEGLDRMTDERYERLRAVAGIRGLAHFDRRAGTEAGERRQGRRHERGVGDRRVKRQDQRLELAAGREQTEGAPRGCRRDIGREDLLRRRHRPGIDGGTGRGEGEGRGRWAVGRRIPGGAVARLETVAENLDEGG